MLESRLRFQESTFVLDELPLGHDVLGSQFLRAPEAVLRDIGLRLAHEVLFNQLIELQAADSREWLSWLDPITAPLTYLAPVADETTRTIRVRFEVANQQHRLRPREYVDVQLRIPSPPTLAIPVSAVTTADNVRGVFVQRETGYAFVPIELGREGGGWVEVRNGLTAGEQVVVDGVFDLKNVLLKEHIESGEGG